MFVKRRYMFMYTALTLVSGDFYAFRTPGCGSRVLRPRGDGVLAPPRPAHPRRPAPRAPRDDGSRERGGRSEMIVTDRDFFIALLLRKRRKTTRARTRL